MTNNEYTTFSKERKNAPLSIGKLFFMIKNGLLFSKIGIRTKEIPIILEYYNKLKDTDKVLEIGNVLSHYIKINHNNYTIVDKYEKSKGVLNLDIMDFKPSDKFDTIFCISTLEHIGYDDEDIDNTKTLKAFEYIKTLLNTNGKAIFTIPLNYNKYLDDYLEKDIIKFDKVNYFMCNKEDNKWKTSSNFFEIDKERAFKESKSILYKFGFPNKRVLVIGEVNNLKEVIAK